MDTTDAATTETWAKCEEVVLPLRFMKRRGERRGGGRVSSGGFKLQPGEPVGLFFGVRLGRFVFARGGRFPGRLRVEIRFEVFSSHLRINAVGRHLHFGEPQDRVEREFPKVVVTPVGVEMSAGETESSSTAAWALVGPGYGLRITARDRGADGGISGVVSVGSAGGARIGYGD